MLGLGLSEYVPHVIYGLFFVVAIYAMLVRTEAGIVYLCFLFPLYGALEKTIKSELPLATDVVDILLICMILGALFRPSDTDAEERSRAPLAVPILLLVIYSMFSLVFGTFVTGAEFMDRFAHWKNYMIMPVLYLITYYRFQDKRWATLLFLALTLALLIMDFRFRQSFGWVQHTHYQVRSRVGGIGFLGPNEFGSFHTIYTLFLAGLFLVDKDMKRRIVYAVLICCNLYALVYSFSRGSYIGFLVGLLFIGVVRSRLLLVLLLVFLFTWRSFVPLSVKERIDGSFVEEGTREDAITVGGGELETAGRKQIWQTALESFAQQPFSGTGYNTFQRLYGMDTHNVYLKTLAEQGVLGLLLYLLFYILAIRSGWRVYRDGSEPFLKACGFGFLCATVGSIVVNLFGDRWTYLQLGGIYWVLWGLVDQEYTKWKMARNEAESGIIGPVPSPLLAPADESGG